MTVMGKKSIILDNLKRAENQPKRYDVQLIVNVQ